MPSIRPSVGVVVGQLDPTQFADYKELVSATVRFAVVMVMVYLVGRLLLVPDVTRLVSARNRDNSMLRSATEAYMRAVVVGTLINGLFPVAGPDSNVDDWTSWPDGKGAVETVDFRVTRIRTVNNEAISMPNTELTTNALTRPYGRKRYRFTECVGIAYADDAGLAFRELVETMREDDRVLGDPESTVRIVRLAGSSVRLQAEFWVGSPVNANLVDVRSQYRRRVKRRFDKEGLTLGSASGRKISGHPDMDPVGGRDGE